MQDNKRLEIFRSAPVPKAILVNAIPAMVAMTMVLIYNLADTFFIGQTKDPLMLAAVSIASPAFLLFLTIGTAFGIGGTSVISRAMGQGRHEYAKKVSSFCAWGAIVVGAALAAGFLIFMDPLLRMIGATDGTIADARTYLTIVSFGGPFLVFGNAFSNIIRAEGQSRRAMMGMLIGNLVNIVLDPIFILVLNWNVMGAAVATLIGNVVNGAYYLIYFLRGKSMLSISPKDFSMKNKIFTGVMAIGIPAAAGNLLASVSHIVQNARMAQYNDLAVAGIGVAGKIMIITGIICVGLGNGIQPLLGFCVGARLWARFKKVLRYSLIFATILSVTLTALCYIFAPQIVSAFLDDQGASDYALTFVRILLITSFTFGIFYVLVSTIQAIGAGVPALIVNISRQGLIFIPMLFVMEAAIGINGLAWAQPVADVLSLTMAVVFYFVASRRIMKRLKAKDDADAERLEAIKEEVD